MIENSILFIKKIQFFHAVGSLGKVPRSMKIKSLLGHAIETNKKYEVEVE